MHRFAILVAAWFTGAGLLAEEPPVWVPGIAARDDSYLLDLELTLCAREAISKDKSLAELNLIVNVHRRVATIRGPVTTREIESKARSCLANVPGLSTIQMDLCIALLESSPSDRPFAWPPSTANPVVARTPRAQAALVLRHPDGGWTPGRSYDVPAPSRSLREAIEGLRVANARFNGIVVDLLGQNISLRGRVRRFEDAAEFAQAISRLPGVQNVRVDEVQVDPK